MVEVISDLSEFHNSVSTVAGRAEVVDQAFLLRPGAGLHLPEGPQLGRAGGERLAEH